MKRLLPIPQPSSSRSSSPAVRAPASRSSGGIELQGPAGEPLFILSAIPKEANPAQFESAVAAALTAKGFQATTASSAFPPGSTDKFQVRRYVADNKVDLLVMERLTTEKAEPVVVTTTVVQGSGWYGGYGGTVASSSQVVAQGTEVAARIEVYDVRTEPDTLIWSGQSNTVDIQGAAQSLAADLVKQPRAPASWSSDAPCPPPLSPPLSSSPPPPPTPSLPPTPPAPGTAPSTWCRCATASGSRP